MPMIYDEGGKAGVSHKSVSRILNNRPNVRQATLEAGQQAIEHLDYRPSTAARLMKSQRARVVGFLNDRVVTSPEASHGRQARQRIRRDAAPGQLSGGQGSAHHALR